MMPVKTRGVSLENTLKINEVKYHPLFLQVDNMVSLYVEGEPLTPLEFILGAIPLLLLPGLVILFVFWLFFQAADPEDERIQNERAPTIIEIAWLVPLILITIQTGGSGFVPIIFTLLFMRMYLVKLYQLFNPDWRTDGTSVGVPVVERLGEAVVLIAEDTRDEGSLLRRFLRAWPIGPVIEFHKRNHKKKWFVIYVYFVIVPFLIVLLLLSIIVSVLIDGVFASII
tara:strand:+ start:349 stop:1029 length:681 start_codon:yes stop_codon:yes gene_type:complete